MAKRYALPLTLTALWLTACAAHPGTQDTVSVVVTRGAESWQFFAFMFFVVYGFGVNFAGAVAEARQKSWAKSAIVKVLLHVLWFVLCLWIIMFTAWGHNTLVKLLFRVKQG